MAVVLWERGGCDLAEQQTAGGRPGGEGGGRGWWLWLPQAALALQQRGPAFPWVESRQIQPATLNLSAVAPARVIGGAEDGQQVAHDAWLAGTMRTSSSAIGFTPVPLPPAVTAAGPPPPAVDSLAEEVRADGMAGVLVVHVDQHAPEVGRPAGGAVNMRRLVEAPSVSTSRPSWPGNARPRPATGRRAPRGSGRPPTATPTRGPHRQQVGGLHGREVAAAVELRPVLDLVLGVEHAPHQVVGPNTAQPVGAGEGAPQSRWRGRPRRGTGPPTRRCG